MKKILFPVIVSGLLLFSVFQLLHIARGQAPNNQDGGEIISRENQGENVREISTSPGDVAPQAPSISFIDSPTVTCYQPDPGQDACYINWYYMSVDANPNYMVAMTVTINTIGIVSRIHGFFQTSMYVPHTMLDRGVKSGMRRLGGLEATHSWEMHTPGSLTRSIQQN